MVHETRNMGIVCEAHIIAYMYRFIICKKNTSTYTGHNVPLDEGAWHSLIIIIIIIIIIIKHL